jgi:UPF0271 protein
MILKALVLDTSAILQGYNPIENVQLFTVPEVIEEVKSPILRLKISSLVTSLNLTVLSPKDTYRDKIETISMEMGEKNSLSSTDKSVLALTLQLQDEKSIDTTLISDDYSVQNISTILGLKNRGIANQGIKRIYKWKIYCPGCKNEFQEMPLTRECNICGTLVKRKPRKK